MPPMVVITIEDDETVPETPLKEILNKPESDTNGSTIKSGISGPLNGNGRENQKDMRFKLMGPQMAEGTKSPNKLVIINDSDTAEESDTKRQTPLQSRHLEKPKRILDSSDDEDDDNLLQVNKKRRLTSRSPVLIDSDESSDEDVSAKSSDSEKQRKLAKLKEMFPDKSELKLSAILDSANGHVNDATTLLLKEQGSPAISPRNWISPPNKTKQAVPSERKERREIIRSNEREAESTDEDEDPLEGVDREKVFGMFQRCTLEQLQRLPGMGAKGAKVLMSLRPFENFDQMFHKIEEAKGIHTSAIINCQDLINELQTVDHLMDRCEKITKTIRKRAIAIQDDHSDADNKQPANLTGTLKHYQLIGLKWLSLVYENKVGGILADEMGLGKTIQAIAYLSQVTDIEQGLKGAHCVICPASTVSNWARELEKWCPDLNVLQYTGSQAERSALRSNIKRGRSEHNILLTTYNTVGSLPDRSFLGKQKFSVLICDEGHMLKNMASQRYIQLHKLNARHRVLLTGTPLQNNLLELISLLNFIMPDMFKENRETLERIFKHNRYTLDISEETEFGEEMDIVKRAQTIMKPFVLRRLKKDVLGDLPKKTTKIVECEMEPNQALLYHDLVEECRQQKLSDEAKLIQNVLMQLRKMANHETLHRSHYGDDLCFRLAKRLSSEPEYDGKRVEHIQEDMFFMSDFEIHTLCQKFRCIKQFELNKAVLHSSGKLAYLRESLPKMQKAGDRVLLFSQFTVMLDILEGFLDDLGIRYLRLDGQTAVDERQDLIDEYSEDTDILVFLLSTRAGGVGINLTASNVVILHDMDFNPHNDRQAEDRAHRVGQTREVTVIKLVCKGTIDEAVLDLANNKLELDQQMKGDRGSTSKGDMEKLIAYSLGL
eukprot:CFRG2746T1